ASKAWAIGLVILVVVLIAGYLIFQKLSTPAPTVQVDNGAIDVQLLLDTQCKFCDQNNTVLAKFTQAKMNYHSRTIDIYSDEGKALAQEFDVNSVPTALVSVKGLDQNAQIQLALQSIYHTRSGYVVVPESFLDEIPRTLTFTNPPQSCSVKPG